MMNSLSKTFFQLRLALHILFISLIMLTVFSVYADESCGTDAIHEQLMKENPEYKSKYLLYNQEIREIINRKQAAKSIDDQTIYTIPVVVHVIHIGEAVGTGSNISDFQISEAIRGLNERYRNIIGNGEDIKFEFCLASRDPDGNLTNGINRVDGRSIPLYQSGGIGNGSDAECIGVAAVDKEVKSLSKWPVLDYYNIWVVHNICGGWAGYAYYPWGAAEDGAVMLSKYMTYTNTTLAHELGHGFNLPHTFNGDGGNLTCPENTNCASQGDFICDTPPHKQKDCGTSNPCTASGVWNNSRYNYMSYCNPSRANALFTPDQRERLRASLNIYPRANLLNTLSCVSPLGTAITIKEIINPVNTICSTNQLSPRIKVLNIGGNLVQSIKFTYSLNNETPKIFNWSGTLNVGKETIIQLPILEESQGENTLDISISMPNGIEDTQNFNTNQSVKFNLSPSSCFVTVWKTDNIGTTSKNQILIPGYSNAGFDVYWEEFDNSSNYDIQHTNLSTTITLPKEGKYRIYIGSNDNGLNRIAFFNSGDRLKILDIEQWGDIKWSSFGSAFHGCENLKVSAKDTPDLESVTSMSNMFNYARSFNISLSNWNLKTISNLDRVFSYSGLQCDNYSKTLIGWANNPNTPSNLKLGADRVSYGKDAVTARNSLISKGWQIIDDGIEEPCESVAIGINKTELGIDLFSIYPNPNDGKFTIEIESSKGGSAVFEIVNILGQVIETQQLKNLNGKRLINVNLSELSKGLYFVKLHFNNEIINRRVVVQ
jgi:hypothetical protein